MLPKCASVAVAGERVLQREKAERLDNSQLCLNLTSAVAAPYSAVTPKNAAERLLCYRLQHFVIQSNIWGAEDNPIFLIAGQWI